MIIRALLAAVDRVAIVFFMALVAVIVVLVMILVSPFVVKEWLDSIIDPARPDDMNDWRA